MTDPAALLRACIQASGLSNARYADERIMRSVRCLNYYLKGERKIPDQVLRCLARQPEYPQALASLNATPTEEPRP